MSDFRERVKAATRVEFLNCLTSVDFDIEHKVNVHDAMGVGGSIDYNNETIEVKIKSAKMSKKKDKDGGHRYVLKIVVE